MSHSIVKRQRGSSRRKRSTSISAARATRQVSSPWRISLATAAPGRAAERYSASSLSLSSMPVNRWGSAGEGAGALDLFLQQQDAVEQRFGGRRAARDIDVDRHDAVAAAHHRIGIMVVAAAIGAGAHRDDPARLGHLVVNLAQRRGHLVA